MSDGCLRRACPDDKTTEQEHDESPATKERVMDAAGNATTVIVADKTVDIEQLARAVRARALAAPGVFHVLVPTPKAAVWRPSEQQHPDLSEGDELLRALLPAVREAAGSEVTGSVSIRHDPMDAVEDLMASRPVDEIILWTVPHHLRESLHVDLPHRLAHLGVAVTTVMRELTPA
jgi:hypothetical protein